MASSIPLGRRRAAAMVSSASSRRIRYGCSYQKKRYWKQLGTPIKDAFRDARHHGLWHVRRNPTTTYGEPTMPILSNPRHEHFAQLIAGGATPTDAYVAVGFSQNSAHASAPRVQ